MASNKNVTFDSSNKYFYSAQEIAAEIKSILETAQEKISTVENSLRDLDTISPVGFQHDRTFNWQQEFSTLIDDVTSAIERANNVREIADLYSKGFTDELQNTLKSNNISFYEFINKVSQGEIDLKSLLGTEYLSSIDYFTILKEGYTVQGYTKIFPTGLNSDNKKAAGKILITAHGAAKDKSRLYVYDETTGKLEVSLEFEYSEHVGGITYDSTNNILWIAGDNGEVHSYDYEKIENTVQVTKNWGDNEPVRIKIIGNNGYEIPNNINTKTLVDSTDHHQDGMDSIYYHNGKLYSCTYSGKGELIETTINITKNSNGSITIVEDDNRIVGELNGATQGIAIYEEDGKNYVITASSAVYASPKSRLTKWEMDANGNLVEDPVGYKYIDHPGLEGIEIDAGYVKGVFEKGIIWDKNQATEVIADISDMNDKPDAVIDKLLSSSADFWDSTHGG